MNIYFAKTIALASLLTFFLVPLNCAQALSDLSISHTTHAQFSAGTEDSNIDLNQSGGDIRLKYRTGTYTDNTDTSFRKGNTVNGTNVTTVDGGKIILNQGYTYTTSSSPSVVDNNVNSARYDSTSGLLYVSAGSVEEGGEESGGVTVIDTKKTFSLSDDEVLITYSSTSTPALNTDTSQGAEYGRTFINPNTNLLYIAKPWSSSALNGLQVVDTNGTVSVVDDAFVGNYSNSLGSARLVEDDLMNCEMDYDNGLIYCVGNDTRGISVIDTKKTTTLADDTSFKYTKDGIYNNTNGGNVLVSATPKIRDANPGQQYNVTFDPQNGLIYLVQYQGVTMINTKKTISPADDISYFYSVDGIYNTTAASAGTKISNTSIPSTYPESIKFVNGLLYVSGGYYSGLTVIDTHGNLDPADDTEIITYSDSTTPALASPGAYDCFVDTVHHLLYVGGYDPSVVSVIDTRGTLSTGDDTLVATYSGLTTPGMVTSDNPIYDLFVSGDSLYISTEKGLAVVNVEGIYSSVGAYISQDFAADSNLWDPVASMPKELAYIEGGSIDGIIYIPGGYDSDNNIADTLYAYDTAINNWSTKTSMPTARDGTVVGVINDKLYVAGGEDTDYNNINTLEVYDPALNSWDTLAPMSTNRYEASAAVYDGNIYVFGGMDENYNILDTLEVYDPILDTWTTKASASLGLFQATAEFINGILYVVGGNDENWTATDDMLAYNPDTNSWTTKPSIPEKRDAAASAVINGKLLIMGGINGRNENVMTTFQFNPTDNTWTEINNLKEIRKNGAAEMVGDSLYIFGGYSSTESVHKISTAYIDNDTYRKSIYNKLIWEATTPTGTSIEMFYSLDNGASYVSLGTNPGTHYLPLTLAYHFKYKALLSTNDTSITPSLDSVEVSYAQRTFTEGFFASDSGTFISSVIDSGKGGSDWKTLSAQSTLVSGTSITYYTRSGDTVAPSSSWSDWTSASSTINSPNSRYLQYKAVLATADLNATPVLSSVTITYDTDDIPPTFTYLPTVNDFVNIKDSQFVDTSIYVLQVKPEDNVEVARVEFYVDDNLICTVYSGDQSGVYSCFWDTTQYHSDIRVLIYDVAGNVSQALTRSVTVDPSLYLNELPKTGKKN